MVGREEPERQMKIVECQLVRVVMSETQDSHILWLKEKDGERKMRIAIGLFEVFAIHRTLNGQTFSRPLTHELFGSVLDTLGATIEAVVVNELRDETFFGRLMLKQNGKTYDIDTRPSDGIALALQQGAPIFVEDSVLTQANREM
ncbi:unnamed protein product [marine sediment metagenome]|uniref:BFN domain-containing protein n=1 Tax=marine sediment metagenome TaxID=412755 RepID=X0UZS5_9ZZZZ